jgi:hypothetical protein
MRRNAIYAMLGIGLFLIFLAPLLRYYADPRVEKAPLDLYDKTISLGTGKYFDTKSLTLVGPHDLMNISVHKGVPTEGSSSVAVYDSADNTKDLVTGQFINLGNRGRTVFDRTTGQTVHCCGESPRQDGLNLKFPFGTERTTYRYWDGTAKKAFPAAYVRDEDLAGLKVYVFRQDIPPTVLLSVDIPGNLVGHPERSTIHASLNYKAVTTVWVEPETGGIMRGEQQANQWLSDPSGAFLMVVSDTNFRNDEASVLRTAKRIKSQLRLLHLLKLWVPLIGLMIGVVLAALGSIRLARVPRAPGPEPAPEAVSMASASPAGE